MPLKRADDALLEENARLRRVYAQMSTLARLALDEAEAGEYVKCLDLLRRTRPIDQEWKAASKRIG